MVATSDKRLSKSTFFQLFSVKVVMSLQQTLIIAVSIFCMLSVYLILQHEQKLSSASLGGSHPFLEASKNVISNLKRDFTPLVTHAQLSSLSSQKEVIIQEPTENDLTHEDTHTTPEKPTTVTVSIETETTQDMGGDRVPSKTSEVNDSPELEMKPPAEQMEVKVKKPEKEEEDEVEKKGLLQCDGQFVDSEVIYWKIVPGDDTYESPITPHHDLHHDRYLTYEYDEGGWNNIRMSLECVLVFTHAMGRTLVSPPRQNLYLLDKKHKDKSGKVRSGMGFEDFFDMDLLRSHKGYHVMTSEQFLAKEGVTGGLHGVLPPKNSTKIGGSKMHFLLQ